MGRPAGRPFVLYSFSEIAHLLHSLMTYPQRFYWTVLKFLTTIVGISLYTYHKILGPIRDFVVPCRRKYLLEGTYYGAIDPHF